MAYQTHFSVLALRPFTIYGPGQNETMLVPRLLESVRAERPIRLAGRDGMQVNPIYVDDAAQAVASAVSLNQTAVVNLAGPEVLSLRAMSESIGAHLGIPPQFETVDDPSPVVVGDIQRMTALLGRPRTRFADAVPALYQRAATIP